MKAAIVMTMDGEMQIVTQDGDFEGGKRKIEELLKLLGVEGLNVVLEKGIETHNHDDHDHLSRMNRVTGQAIGSSH